MAKEESIHVQFDLTRDQRAIKPRYVQGQELPDWEKGPDMHAYIRSMFKRGYREMSKGPGQLYIFRRS